MLLAGLDFAVRALRRQRPYETADDDEHTTPQMRPHPRTRTHAGFASNRPLSNIFSGRANNQIVVFPDL